MSRRQGPPPISRRLLARLLPAHLRSSVLEDLAERHAETREASGRRAADRWYRDQVRRSVVPALTGRRAGNGHAVPPDPGGGGLASWVQDLRFALRWSALNPGFTVVVVATLALGIGANSTMFSVVRGVLLRPLPYADADRIARYYNTDVETGEQFNPVSWVEAVEYRDAAAALPGVEALLAFDVYSVTLSGLDDPRRVRATFAPPGFFSVFGVAPQLGRTFTPEENLPGGDAAVVLSHGLWREAFGGSEDVLGQELIVDARPRRIVGVMPADFDFYANSRVWLPLALDEAGLVAEQVRSHGTPALIKIAPGFTFADVERDLDGVIAGVLERYPEHEDMHRARIVGLQSWMTDGIRPTLLTLMGAVGCLLLVGCANVANLLLARAESRRREFAVRRALGAGTGRLARQLLVESTALALVAGAIGLALTWWAREIIVASIAGVVPRAESITVDPQVLLFTLGASLLTGAIFGLAPLARWRREDTGGALREGRGTGDGGGLRFRQGLIVAEVGLVVVLLMGAGLLGRSFLALVQVDPGVDTRSTLTFELSLPEARYPTQPEARDFFEQLIDRLETLGGVEAVGAASWLPFGAAWSNWGFELEATELPEDAPIVVYTLVLGDYFDAVGIPVVRGRRLGTEDRDSAMLITRGAEAAYFDGEEPLGRRGRLAGIGPWRTIVGVVDDYRNQGLQRDPDPGIYIPHTALSFGNEWFPRQMGVVLRTRTEPTDLVPAVRDVVRSMDPSLPVERLLPMADLVEDAALSQPRLAAALFGSFALLALLLGGVGIHSVVSWAVQRETREIGVRLALGAPQGSVCRHVVVRALTPVALGLLAGLATAAWLGRWALASMLVQVQAFDPVTVAAVVGVLFVAATLAVVAPTRRALAVDPVEALRDA